MIETQAQPETDPAEWDEWPDGYGAVIARHLEDEGWHVGAFDDGTETGVWFARGRCWSGKGDGHGTCNNPVDILADLTDPEEIAGRADTVMREIGLTPGPWTGPARCTDGCMDDDEELPHAEYMQLVADALTEHNSDPSRWWIETVDGKTLDGVFTYDEHPEVVFLGWDQNHGWALVTGRGWRQCEPLPLGVYAPPVAVAAVVAARLRGESAPEHGETWDGAAGVLAAIEAWEASR